MCKISYLISEHDAIIKTMLINTHRYALACLFISGKIVINMLFLEGIAIVCITHVHAEWGLGGGWRVEAFCSPLNL